MNELLTPDYLHEVTNLIQQHVHFCIKERNKYEPDTVGRDYWDLLIDEDKCILRGLERFNS